MKNFIETPLPIVYISPTKDVTIKNGLDLSHSEEVYGIQVPVIVDYKLRTVFVSKVNGPSSPLDAVMSYNLSVVGEQAAKLTVPRESMSPEYFSGREHILCVRDLVALRKILPLFNKTVQILRENHIPAEEFREGNYWALSDNTWDLHDSTQSELFNVNFCHLYSVNMDENVSFLDCVKSWGKAFWREKDNYTLRYNIRTGYMLNDEPDVFKSTALGQVVSEYFH